MRKTKNILCILIALALLFGLVPASAAAAGVDSGADLQTQITGLGGVSGSFELTDIFVGAFGGSVALPALVSGQTVTIDGGGKTLVSANEKHFEIAAGNAGVYVFANLTFEGNLGAGGLSAVGEVQLANCLFQNISGGVVVLADNTTLTANNSTFLNNISGNSGASIVASGGSNKAITLSNTYFKGNSVTSVNARGAAVYIYNCANASLTVDACVFEENTSPGLGTRNDGAAISFTMDGQTGTLAATPGSFSITNSTFVNNACGDDGAAMLIEGHTASAVTTPSITGKIENCTFVGNVATGADNNGGVGSPGGAIAIFARATLDLVNNTFYANSKTSGGFMTIGAAVGASGDYNAGVIAQFNYMNNLFVGNTVPNNATATTALANVGDRLLFYTFGTDLGGNVNLAASAAQDVFGTAAPALADNGCAVAVGYGTTTTLKSLLIAPSFVAANTAAGAGVASGGSLGAPAADKRGQTRSGLVDSGSVDIKPAYFDANGGEWDTSAHAGYSYGELSQLSAADTTLAVAVASHNATTLGAPYVSALTHPDSTQTLLGWHTDQTATTALYAANATNIPADGSTYYAIWAAATYTVTFDSQGGSAIGPVSNVAAGATIANPGSPTRSGYTFGGWYREAACTTEWVFASDTVSGDLTLYAKWTPAAASYTVTFNSQGGSAVNPITGVAAGSVVAQPGAPARSGYTFGGWYREPGCTTAWNFASDAVSGNLMLYAKWTLNASPAATTPQTGDPNAVWPYAALLALAALGGGALVATKRRKQDR